MNNEAVTSFLHCAAEQQEAHPAPTGIPEELRPLWIGLAHSGASLRDLAKFEGYIAGNAPMSDEQMQAGMRVAKAFSSVGRGKKYKQLENMIMNTLHDRYAASTSNEEKTKICWLVDSIFSGANLSWIEHDFNKKIGGIGANYSAQLHDIIEEGAHKALDMPRTGNIGSLMNMIIKRDIIDLTRAILGHDYMKYSNVARPVSLEGCTNDGRRLMDVVSSHSGEPLTTLVSQEEQDTVQKVLAQLQGTLPKFTPKEQEFFRHYSDMVLADNGRVRLDAIASQMQVTPTRASQLRNAVLAKLQEHFLGNDEISSALASVAGVKIGARGRT